MVCQRLPQRLFGFQGDLHFRLKTDQGYTELCSILDPSHCRSSDVCTVLKELPFVTAQCPIQPVGVWKLSFKDKLLDTISLYVVYVCVRMLNLYDSTPYSITYLTLFSIYQCHNEYHFLTHYARILLFHHGIGKLYPTSLFVLAPMSTYKPKLLRQHLINTAQ